MGQVLYGCATTTEAIVERQQRVPPERDDDRFRLYRKAGRARVPRTSRQREEQAHAEDFYYCRRDDSRSALHVGGDHGASGRPGDARRHHPSVRRVGQGRWPAPQDKPNGVPGGVLRRLPIIAWSFVSGRTNRSRRTASRSKPARSLADAARCCVSSATPTIWSPPRSSFIATGFRPAARKHTTSRPIVSG